MYRLTFEINIDTEQETREYMNECRFQETSNEVEGPETKCDAEVSILVMALLGLRRTFGNCCTQARKNRRWMWAEGRKIGREGKVHCIRPNRPFSTKVGYRDLWISMYLRIRQYFNEVHYTGLSFWKFVVRQVSSLQWRVSQEQSLSWWVVTGIFLVRRSHNIFVRKKNGHFFSIACFNSRTEAVRGSSISRCTLCPTMLSWTFFLTWDLVCIESKGVEWNWATAHRENVFRPSFKYAMRLWMRVVTILICIFLQ